MQCYMTFDYQDATVRRWLIEHNAQGTLYRHYGDAVWKVGLPDDAPTFLTMVEQLGRFRVEKKKENVCLLIFQNLDDICNAEHS